MQLCVWIFFILVLLLHYHSRLTGVLSSNWWFRVAWNGRIEDYIGAGWCSLLYGGDCMASLIWLNSTKTRRNVCNFLLQVFIMWVVESEINLYGRYCWLSCLNMFYFCTQSHSGVNCIHIRSRNRSERSKNFIIDTPWTWNEGCRCEERKNCCCIAYWNERRNCNM